MALKRKRKRKQSLGKRKNKMLKVSFFTALSIFITVTLFITIYGLAYIGIFKFIELINKLKEKYNESK